MPGDFITWCWRIEYIISIFLAFLVFFIPMPKRKHGTLIALISFALVMLIWISRVFIFREQEPSFVRIIYYILCYIELFFIIYFTMRCDFKQCLFIFTGIICLQHSAYKLTYFIVALIDINLRHHFIYFIIYLGVQFIVGLGFYFFFTKNLKKSSINTGSYMTGIIAAVAFITIFFVSYFTQDNIKSVLDKYTLALIQVYGIVLPIIYVAVLFQNLKYVNTKHEAEILEIISSKDKERYELAKTTMDQINIKYHDLKHALKEERINDEEKGEIKETITNYSTIVDSGNHTLDILLYEKKAKSERLDVHIISIVDGTLLNFMKAHHLYSLLSNLIDNAIESAKKMEEPEKRNIRLSISKNRGSVIITLDNFTKNTPKFIDGMPQTTNQDKIHHGFGLRSVQQIVNQYSGILSVSLKDEEFKVKIIFPLTNKKL